MSDEDFSLAKIVGDHVVIRIPVEAFGDERCIPTPYLDTDFKPRFKVTDSYAFATEVVRHLNDEAEDGTTLIHQMLDEAVSAAIEYGADGIEEVNK